jgi:hypothetical protein
MTARCLCGLAVVHHYDANNRKLACDEARRRHPRATVRKRALRSLLAMSGRTR